MIIDGSSTIQGVASAQATAKAIYRSTASAQGTAQASSGATVSGPTVNRFHPAAIAGTYKYYRHANNSTWTEGPVVGHFSRLDLFVGIGTHAETGLNGGLIWADIDVWNGSAWEFVRSDAISTYSNRAETFVGDEVVNEQGVNLCQRTVMQLPFDRYRVTFSAGGPDLEDPNTDCVYRLNGYATYEQDPLQTHLPHALTTDDDLLALKPENQEKEIRNHVIVVGARKATVTDSKKYEEDNPNNPRTEFHISVVSDVASQLDPAAPNYVGTKRIAVVVDEKVTSTDFARWAARTVLIRNRLPKAEATFDHTAIPVLDLRDPVHVVDSRYGSVDHLLWVTGINESWSLDEATSSIEATSYAAIPSYVPREDIDIDAHFGGKPAYNIGLSYLNILGQPVTQADLGEVNLPQVIKTNQAATATSATLPAHVIPETVYLGKPGQHYPVIGASAEKPLVNHPYRHFWNQSWNASYQPVLTWDFQEGDGTANVYDQAAYSFPGSWSVNFAKLDARLGKNVFYDPYSSDQNLVKLSFDALVSGFYRISVWDANWRRRGYQVPVAWLTGEGNDPEDPEAHWQYMDASAGVQFLYDGSDNIGFWNRLMSADYAKNAEGDWGDKPSAVGASYYAWNDKDTDPRTQIGDPVEANYQVVKDGLGNVTQVVQQYYSIGQYGKFYIRIEAVSDSLMRKTGKREPREVNSASKQNQDGHTVNPSGMDSPFYLYTHLPEPEQAEIELFDWDPNKLDGGVAVGDWTQGTTKNGWAKIEDYTSEASEVYQARIREGRPVKFRFKPVARRGKLFEKNGAPDGERWGGKLSRQVHLARTVFDQMWTFYGTPWSNIRDENMTADEEKRLTSRMYHNHDHTLEFQDDGWRSGKELQDLEWIFRPSDFRKDFGLGLEEPLRYADYEQTEAIPGFTQKPTGGSVRSERSFLTLAYITDLFYFSAFVQDRSGRRQWCIDRGQVDKSKIVTSAWRSATAASKPEYRVDYPRLGADKYLVRSIFTRQWVEPGWLTTDMAASPAAQYGVTDSYQLKWVQPKITDFDPYAGVLSTSSTDPKFHDRHFEAYQTHDAYVNAEIRRKTEGFEKHLYNNHRDRWAVVDPIASIGIQPGQFGSWTFDRGGYSNWYSPSPCRDFHPYWSRTMPDAGQFRMDYYSTNDANYSAETRKTGVSQTYLDHIARGTHGALCVPSSSATKPMRDVMAQDQWYGWLYRQGYAEEHYTANSGNTVERLKRYGPRVEWQVRDWLTELKKIQEQTAHLFDYVRVDELARFDQFRGVWSRAPYTNRGSAEEDDDNTYWSDKVRFANRQSVTPSGVYLLNTANYTDYVVTRQNAKEEGVFCHLTQGVRGWFDVRFRHHYVWQSAQHFPVAYSNRAILKASKQGVAAYEFYRMEHTGAYPIASDQLSYDPGAWTGWKDDIVVGTAKNQWTDMPFLRWAECYTRDQGIETMEEAASWVIGGDLGDGKSESRPFLSGGYEYTTADTKPALSGRAAYTTYFLGEERWFKRANIFADVRKTSCMRLAVGPRVPENRGLVMNLTLPARLAGL